MRSLSLAPVVLAVAASAAFAQTAALPEPSETVTVVGQRPTDAEMATKVIQQFVELHAARSRKSGLITRAAPSGICPVTMGLPQQYDDFVTQRIASVAREIGSSVEPGKCLANVEVLFTDDPQAVVTTLAEKTDGLIIGMHFTHERGSVIHVYRPIQAWYMTGTKRDPNAGSQTLVNGESPGPGAVTIDTAYGPSPFTGTGSRIRVKNSGQIVNALIVADARKVAGEEIGPIADYVSLLALSQPASFDGCNALPSILDLMSSGCPGREKPKALTESDMAYLKALYAADIATSGYTAQENIAKGMDGNLGAPKP